MTHAEAQKKIAALRSANPKAKYGIYEEYGSKAADRFTVVQHCGAESTIVAE